MQNKFFIVAGEASGDNYGANIVKELLKLNKDLQGFGIGGENIKSTGVKLIENINKLTVVGLTEVISHISEVLKILKKIKNFLKIERPDFLILIDFPDFNFRVAKYAYELKIPVFYFVSPQVWAWRQGRVKFFKKYVKKLFVIFPFEVEFYRQFAINVEFVGHPLSEKIRTFKPLKNFAKSEFYNIGLLPGSRNSEIKRLLPTMVKAAILIKNQYPFVRFLLPVAPTLDFNRIKSFINLDYINVIKGHSYDVMYSSNLIIAASGTATLEAALFGKPVIIIYKVSLLSYLIGRALIKTPYIGMSNLLLGKMANPELIQNKVTPTHIYLEIKKFLENKLKYFKVSNQNKSLLHILYKKDTFKVTAEKILQLC